MPYDPQLPGCFGEIDSEFGLHPLDQDRAFEWLADLRKRQVDWIDAKEQVLDFLREKGAPELFIRSQVAHARKMLGPWLTGPVGEDEP